MNPTREDLEKVRDKMKKLLSDSTEVFGDLTRMDELTWSEGKKVGDGRTWGSLVEFAQGADHIRSSFKFVEKMLDKPD